VPANLLIEDVAAQDRRATMLVRSRSARANYPGCGAASERVHSRYRRTLADLPIAGQPVRLLVNARHFRCDVEDCDRRIFTERLEANKLWARRHPNHPAPLGSTTGLGSETIGTKR
jgi:transposase